MRQIFTNVRFKDILEIRGADTPPFGYELAPVSFLKGLFRNEKSLEKLFDLCNNWKINDRLNLIELSYRYLLNNPAVSEIIIGAKNIPQIDFAIESLAKGKLPNNIYDEVFRLLSEYSISAW